MRNLRWHEDKVDPEPPCVPFLHEAESMPMSQCRYEGDQKQLMADPASWD